MFVLPEVVEAYSPKVCDTLAQYGEAQEFENCGRLFHEAHFKVTEIAEEIDESEDQDASADDNTPNKKINSKNAKVRSGMLKLDDNLKDCDLYALLRVSETANNKELKDAYRQMCLEYHPDKAQDDKSKEAINEEFIRITTAYEILLDGLKRRKYDSARYFDDSIPKEGEISSEEDFYRIFTPIFARNAKWSIVQPVPALPGPEVTEIQEVQTFYTFWLHFDSWRDFDVKIVEEEGESALEDPEKADGREERRHIEKQNARLRQKFRNKESKRIMQLTELSEKFDSRIKAWKEEQFAKKNAGKVKKEHERLAKLAAEEAALKAEEEAKVAEEKKRVEEKAVKENEKQIIKNLRRDLRNICHGDCLTVCHEQFQEMVLLLGNAREGLEKYFNELSSAGDKTQCIFAKMRELKLEPIVLEESFNLAKLNNKVCVDDIQVSLPVAADNKKGSKKKNKKKANEETIEETIEKAEEAMDREMAHTQHSVDTKKKNEAKKKQQQQQKAAQQNKLDEEKRKREAEKQKKDAEAKQKKADEDRARAEEQKAKQRREAEAQRNVVEEERVMQIKSEQFVKVRDEQIHAYEKLTDVKIDLLDALTPELTVAIASTKGDTEDRLDVACALIANFTGMKFFEVGKRPSPNCTVQMSSAMRNKLKKIRQQCRDALKPLLSKAPGTVQKEFVGILAGEFPEEEWEILKAEGKTAGKAGSKKKKNKNTNNNKEEDLDALFAEMGIEETSSKKKNKK